MFDFSFFERSSPDESCEWTEKVKEAGYKKTAVE
jgi:hypothetical protein